MTSPGAAPDDNRELYSRLRAMWSRRDPMPEGLIGDILVGIATEDLGTEYALLTLVERSEELAGVRGLSDSRTLEFSDGVVTILLRVSPADGGKRRIDGWLAPASTGTLRLEQGGVEAPAETTVEADNEGRFVFAEVDAGRTKVWLDRSPSAADATQRGFATPEFEL
jgi:hypothetical protein